VCAVAVADVFAAPAVVVDVAFFVGLVCGGLLAVRRNGVALLVACGPLVLALKALTVAPVVGADVAACVVLWWAAHRRALSTTSATSPTADGKHTAAVVAVLTVVSGVVYSVYSVTRHARFGSGSWDYGCYVHNAWLFAHGVAFDVTARSAVLGDVAFWGGTNHFMPSLLFTAPVSWLMEATGSTSWLAIAQVLVVVVAAIPLAYAAHRRGLGTALTSAVVVAWLLHVGTQAALLFDVHEVAPAPALLFSLLVVVDDAPSRRRVLLVCVCAAVLAGTKEGSWLYVAGVGALLAARRPGWRRVGAGLIVGGSVGFVVVVGLVQPALIEPGASMLHASRFVAVDGSGSGIGNALRSWLMHPGQATRALWSPAEKLGTLTTSLAGFSALPLFSAEALLLGLPNLAERFLADKREMWGLAFHYGLYTAAWLAWGAVDVLGRLKLSQKQQHAAAFVVLTGVVATFVGSPRAPDLLHLQQPYFASADDVARFERALAVVHDDDKVVAQNHFLPHLALREHIWLPEDRCG
jgi:uncharacterized membrane protein